MHILTCQGGYPIPMAKGKLEVVGVEGTVSSTAAVSRMTLIDGDDFAIVPEAATNLTFIDVKGTANYDGTLRWFPPEPLKLRKGIAISDATTNISKLVVYIR